MNLFPFSTANFLRSTQLAYPTYSPKLADRREVTGRAVEMSAPEAQALAADGLHGARAIAKGFSALVKGPSHSGGIAHPVEPGGSKPGWGIAHPVEPGGSKPGWGIAHPVGSGGSKPGWGIAHPVGSGGSKPGWGIAHPVGSGGSKPGWGIAHPVGSGGAKLGHPPTVVHPIGPVIPNVELSGSGTRRP